MALRVSNATFFSSSSSYLLLLSLSLFTFTYSDAQQSPAAIYVFGDSLVDVGNNNYLDTLAKANFPHNGIDFPGMEPTGRFSNGKNAADFIAEKAGLASPPPYLSLKTSSFRYLSLKTSSFPIAGVSFASGSAGVFNSTNENQTIPLQKQMDCFSVVYEDLVNQLGPSGAQAHLSNSLFTVVIGSNDLFVYFGTSGSNKTDPQQYVDSMVLTLKGQLELMHGFGARKYVIAGIGTLGCCPLKRKENESGACNDEANYWAVKYNEGLKSMLKELQSELEDINYAYLDVYGIFASFILTPSAYGFTEVKAACCGLGRLGAQIPCLRFAAYCSNRSDHLFWDFVHPTETAASIVVNTTFDLNQLNY